jgi:hypothetical protein
MAVGNQEEARGGQMSDRFLVFGSYGLKNAADEGMLYASLQQLGALFPEAQFSVVAEPGVVVPSSVRNRTDFVRRTPQSILRQLLVSGALVRAGGLFLCHHVGNKRGPSTLLRTFALLLAAKMLRAKVATRRCIACLPTLQSSTRLSASGVTFTPLNRPTSPPNALKLLTKRIPQGRQHLRIRSIMPRSSLQHAGLPVESALSPSDEGHQLVHGGLG